MTASYWQLDILEPRYLLSAAAPMTSMMPDIGLSEVGVEVSDSGQVTIAFGAYNDNTQYVSTDYGYSPYNGGSNPVAGPVNFKIYASTNEDFSGGRILVDSFTRDLNIPDTYEANVDVTETFSMPQGVAPGNYYLIVEAIPDTNPLNVSPTVQEITVLPDGSTELMPVLNTKAILLGLNANADGTVTASINLLNYSNITNIGQVNFQISLTPVGQSSSQPATVNLQALTPIEVGSDCIVFGGDGDNSPIGGDPVSYDPPVIQSTLVDSFNRDINVGYCGGAQEVEDTFTLPAGIVPGDYYVTVQATPTRTDGVINERETEQSGTVVTIAQDGSASILQTVAVGVEMTDTQLKGSDVTTTINLTNEGNAADVGTMNFTVAVVPCNADWSGQPTPVASFSRDVNIANDGTTSDSFQQDFTIPQGLAPGYYYLSIQATLVGHENIDFTGGGMYSTPEIPFGVGQDGAITLSPMAYYPEEFCLTSTPPVYYQITCFGLGSLPQGGQGGPILGGDPVKVVLPGGPTSVAAPSNPDGFTAGDSGAILNLSSAVAAAPADSVSPDASNMSALSGAAIQASSTTPMATTRANSTTLDTDGTWADDQPAAADSGGLVDLLAPGSADSVDGGSSAGHLHHSAHSAPQTSMK